MLLSSGQVKAGEIGVGAAEEEEDDEEEDEAEELTAPVGTTTTFVTVVVVARPTAVEFMVWTMLTCASWTVWVGSDVYVAVVVLN